MTATENGNGSDPEGVRRNDRGELVLSLESLRPKPRWLEIRDANGDLVELKIPGGLSLETMLDLQAMERELTSADATDATAIEALRRFTDVLTDLVSDSNPDLPDDFRLELGIAEATHLLIFIAQPDDSIAEKFARAITQEGAEKPDGASDDAHALARAAGLEPETEGEKSAPLRSMKRSSSPSSRSAKSTAGRRSGGSGPAARSRRSGSTSGSRSKGKKSASATD